MQDIRVVNCLAIWTPLIAEKEQCSTNVAILKTIDTSVFRCKTVLAFIYCRLTEGIMESLNAISLFSGGGGMDLGLMATGWNILFSTDIDNESCITLQKGKQIFNSMTPTIKQTGVVHRGDISKLKKSFILSTLPKDVSSIHLLAGGPPCQAFSVFGKRKGLKDERGELVFEYTRMLRDLKPEVFVFENVPGILTENDGLTWELVLNKLRRPGVGIKYHINEFHLDAANFLVPQNRKRVIVIGTRKAIKMSAINPICGPLDTSSHTLKKRTVSDAFNKLPSPNTKAGKSISNHKPRRHSKRIIDRYTKLKFGERDHKTRINKLDPSKPSFTIIVGSDKGGGKGHVHPKEGREVTPRESARIQSFPDWWEFTGSVRHEIRQVGNAVPPILGAIIGNHIRSEVYGLKPIPLIDIITFLGQEHLLSEGEINLIK